MNAIDLNCDVGELPEAIAGGAQQALLPFFTSVNIACGGHAGDAATMRTTIEQAQRLGLSIGAHPGYPDREHFGRIVLQMPREALADSIFDQVNTLAGAARACGARITHVKPHGALYNEAARNGDVASAIARGVARWKMDVVLVGLAGSLMLKVFAAAGFVVAAEAFADRRYEPDGRLRSRNFPDAVIIDPEEAARQAVLIAQDAKVMARDGSHIPIHAETICIHGDSPGVAATAAAVSKALRQAGIALRPFAVPGASARQR